MDYSSSSFFFAIGREANHDLIEKLGITPRKLSALLFKMVSAANKAVLNLCRIRPTPSLVFKYKYSTSLEIETEFIIQNAQDVHCIVCKCFLRNQAIYTIKNTQNLMALSITNIQLHSLAHGDFEALGQSPRQIHDVLGIGYYCEGV